MGTWGPGLYQNDVSEDIRGDFIDKCKRGHTIEEATEIFIKEYAEELNDDDDAPNFWLALADVQWKYGKLLPKVKENALYHIENELKNETYNEFDKSDAKKRKKVLEDLREKFNSPMPPEKKISQYKLYKCEWKIGDTYAYPLDADIWKDTDYYMDYLIMQKIGERDWWPGHIIPVVRVKITENKHLPQNLQEIEALRYIMFAKGHTLEKEEMEALKDVINFEEDRICDGKYISSKDTYMLALGSTSKRIIPKKLIFLGNYNIFKEPSYEEKVDYKDLYIYSEWKFLDKYVLGLIKNNFLRNI